jgi:hypothetical protein
MFSSKGPVQRQNERGVETKEVHTMWSHPNSESAAVAHEIEEMARKGWRLVDRKNDEGMLLGLTATTTLRFARPTAIRGIPIDRIKFEVKKVDVGYCRAGTSSSQLHGTVQKMSREGWALAGRTSHEGFFGLTAYTRLVFMQPRM